MVQGLRAVPELRPSEAEFNDPVHYLSSARVQRLGSRYGMLKVIPPASFRPPMCIDRASFSFHARVQKLPELHLLHRARLLFAKQLSNFLVSRGEAPLAGPTIDESSEPRIYYYDLYMARNSSYGKSKFWSSQYKKLVRQLGSTQQFQVLYKQHIAQYAKYLLRSQPTVNEDHPLSILNDEVDQDDLDCAICDEQTDAQDMIICCACHRHFHESCIAKVQKKEGPMWVCETCILGNGYYGFNEEESQYTLEDFIKYDKDNSKIIGNFEDPEAKFWELLNDLDNPIIAKYGADIQNNKPGQMTGFPLDTQTLELAKYSRHPMNLFNLPRAPGSLLALLDKEISGMTLPWLYVGSTFSTFCWHMEDQYTLSANYQHEGEPKYWYSIPGKYSNQFHDFLQDIIPDLFRRQPDLMHQLVTMISPYSAEFKTSGVECFKAIQYPNEYIVTFPKCYHAGFNSGYNLNEAVNFVIDDWIPYGVEAIKEYRLTRKQPLFDIYSMLLDILSRYLGSQESKMFDTTLIRICYETLLKFYGSETKKLKTVMQLLDNVIDLSDVDGQHSKNRLPTPSSTFNDEEDDEIYCDKCNTLCSLSYISIQPSAKKRKISADFTAKAIIYKGTKLCLDDFLELEGTPPIATLIILKDTAKFKEILKLAGNSINS